MEIKEYKQLTRIVLYKGNDIISSMPLEDLYKFIQTGSKFIMTDGKIINISDINFAEVFEVDDIENYILSQPKDIQNVLRLKQKEQPINSKRLSYMEHQVSLYYERKNANTTP